MAFGGLCVVDGVKLKPVLIANAANLLGGRTGHAFGQLARLPPESGKEPKSAAQKSAGDRLGDTAPTGGQAAPQEAGTCAQRRQPKRRARRFAQDLCQRAAIQMRVAPLG